MLKPKRGILCSCLFLRLPCPLTRDGLYAIYLEKRVSTLQSGWAEGSDRAEGAPEVDAGEQGAGSQ